jgi:hypothetical protein
VNIIPDNPSPFLTPRPCVLEGCLSEHHRGEVECYAVVAEVPFADPAPDRDTHMFVSIFLDQSGEWADLDIDCRAVRVRLGDLTDAVAATAHQMGDVDCEVVATALPLAEENSAVLLSAIRSGGDRLVNLALDDQVARVQLDDLINAVAALGGAR